jgi:formylglycine-generating enzyme required for sulfatase activity
MSVFVKIVVAVSVALLFLSSIGGASGAKPAPDGMVLIPDGEFLMGSTPEEIEAVKKEFGKKELFKNYAFDAEVPKRKVWLKAFYIGINEVTNLEYIEFINATGYSPPPQWANGRYPAGTADRPVLYVTKADAEAYAKWKHGRLPTEEEWEKAARGADGRIFPWGNQFDPEKASTADSDLEYFIDGMKDIYSANKVTVAPDDLSPYGVHGMAGNVREWTATRSPQKKDYAVIKGASWVDLNITARAAYREYVPVTARSHILGFRCVKDVE